MRDFPTDPRMRVSQQTSAIMSAWCIMVNSFSNGFMFSLRKAFSTNICKAHLFVSLAVCISLFQETESLTCALTYLHMFEFLFSQTKWESLYVCFCMCCLYAPVHACVSHAWYVQTAASNGLKITWNFSLILWVQQRHFMGDLQDFPDMLWLENALSSTGLVNILCLLLKYLHNYLSISPVLKSQNINSYIM